MAFERIFDAFGGPTWVPDPPKNVQKSMNNQCQHVISFLIDVGLVLMEGKIRHSGSIKFAVAFLTTTFSIGQISGPYISGLMIDFFENYENAMLLSGCSLSMAGMCMINYKLLFSRR